MSDVAQIIEELNAAADHKNVSLFVRRLDPNAVWEHNIGIGSPEEGVYHGRDEIARLLDRILEGWEYMRLIPDEIQELKPDVYRIRGQLHCKHADSGAEIVEPYEQQIEFRDGLMVKGQMVLGGSLGE